MERDKLTLTIGIPAYNEEANIKYLLTSLLNQKLESCILEKIVVASDGSTDSTPKLVRSMNSDLIMLIDDGERRGQAERQNQIITFCNSGVLVLLNADIAIEENSFIEKLVAPIVDGRAELSSSAMDVLSPRNFFESVLQVGYQIKKSIFESVNGGVNVLTCHGAARGLSRGFYKNFRFSGSVGEDAYSFFYCVKNWSRYSYVKEAVCYIRCSGSLSDHLRQSFRFFQSKYILSKVFGTEISNKYYHIPIHKALFAALHHFSVKPFHTAVYFSITLYSYLAFRFVGKISDTWEASQSSKVLK